MLLMHLKEVILILTKTGLQNIHYGLQGSSA